MWKCNLLCNSLIFNNNVMPLFLYDPNCQETRQRIETKGSINILELVFYYIESTYMILAISDVTLQSRKIWPISHYSLKRTAGIYFMIAHRQLDINIYQSR